MFHYSEILSRYDRVRFIQYRDFLKSRAIEEEKYYVTSETENILEEKTAIVGITYSASPYDDGNARATTRLRMNDGDISIVSGLPTALGLLLFIFDDVANMIYLKSLDKMLDARSALSTMKIESNILKPDVVGDMPGNYIAPIESGWRLYNVDVHGVISPIADCEFPAPLVYVEFSNRQDQATNLSARVGMFVPKNSAQLLQD